jgi:hypothetical protein
MRGISWVAEDLLNAKEGVSSLELVGYWAVVFELVR